MRGQLTKEVDQELEFGFLGLLTFYAKEYKRNPKNFIRCFLKFRSIRSGSAWIVTMMKEDLKEARKEKDFKEWASKQNVEEKWKPVLNDLMVLIYAILK